MSQFDPLCVFRFMCLALCILHCRTGELMTSLAMPMAFLAAPTEKQKAGKCCGILKHWCLFCVSVQQSKGGILTTSSSGTKQLRLEGTSGERHCNRPAQSRGSSSRMLRAVASQFLHISRAGESASSLGNLFQCVTTLTVKQSVFYD